MIAFLMVGLLLLLVGIQVLSRRQPLVIPLRWLLPVTAAFPAAEMSAQFHGHLERILHLENIPQWTSREWMICSLWLLPVAIAVIVELHGGGGLAAFAVKPEVFRSAVRVALDELGVRHIATEGRFVLKDLGTELDSSNKRVLAGVILGMLGCVILREKHRSDGELMTRLRPLLSACFASNAVGVSWRHAVAYLFGGVACAAGGLFFHRWIGW